MSIGYTILLHMNVQRKTALSTGGNPRAREYKSDTTRMAEPNAPMPHPAGRRPDHKVHMRAQGRARYPAQRAYAALDLGTNNCRLLIARPQGDRFAVVDAFSRIVRLGEGLSAHGELSDAAMARTLSALHICADKLMRRDVHLSRAVATEACRSARNGPAFVKRVYDRSEERRVGKEC